MGEREGGGGREEEEWRRRRHGKWGERNFLKYCNDIF